jgi:hypothetical protein
VRWILLRGLLGSALLVVAGLAYARVPAHSRVLLLPWRQGPHHLAVGLGVAAVGLVLLTWAWLSLVRQVTGDPAGVRWSRLATVVWTAPLLAAPPLFSGDGWSYVATGYLAGHGYSPYEATPSILGPALVSGVSPMWRSTTSPYGPLPLIWGGAFSRVTSDPWLLLVANRTLAFVALRVLALAGPALARRSGHDPARASALAIASPLVVVHGIGGLHNDLVVAGLAALALWATRPGRWFWGAVVVGLAAAVKLPGAGIAVGVVLLSLVPGAPATERLRSAVRVTLVAAGTLLLVSVGSDLGLGWVSGLSRTAHEVARLAPTALTGRWIRIGLDAQGTWGQRLAHEIRPERTVETIGLVALAVVGLLILLRRRIPDESAAIAGCGLLMLAAVVLSPALHYWYFLWALPLLACARPSARGERTLIALLAALGITAVADPSMHVPWFDPVAIALLVLAPALAWTADPWLARSVGREAGQRRTLGRR